MEFTKNNKAAGVNESINQSEPVDQDLAFHAVAGEQAAQKLQTEIATGLSAAEAGRRLERQGANTIESKTRRRFWQLLLGQFSSIIIWLLAAASAVAFFTDNKPEAAAILVVLLINAVIGSAIEWQAGRALDALKKATRTPARVRRDGGELIIDAEDLAAGDIVILSAGDRVPADARILESASLRADESTLTGESVPVEKNHAPVERNAPLAERSSMLYLGTTVVAGRASAIVTATGGRTEIGRIGKLVAEAEEGKTPLEKRLAELGKTLVYIVLGIAAVVFLAGFYRGESIWLMLEISISLAVAAVPEGLPAVTTLILALGVLRMARRNALVRRLSAVETLGSTTVICTDKTGTLTENRMTVREYRLASGRVLEISENVVSDSTDETRTQTPDEIFPRLLRVSVLCNEAALATDGAGAASAIGDPTETALLTAFGRLGFDLEDEKSAYEKICEHPFDSETKRMITILREKRGEKCFAALKGAPAVVLDYCDTYISETGETLPLSEKIRAGFLQLNEEMAGDALRVLAFADRELAADFRSGQEFENRFTFLGFAGMTDPPRAGATEAVTEALKAGIRVVMLTGDQIKTARAIAERLKLNRDGEIFALHSSEMTDASGEKLAEMARRAHVFARVSPEDKFRIVKALQETGEIVAVTGDGVNDAPALKQSDIGVAMGMRGTEVAKEAADIVLTDDNFATIVKAVESGRVIYANIIKFVHLMFSKNLGEVLLIFVAISVNLPLPLLPLQILWINLLTDVFPALSLAFEPVSPEIKFRPPQSSQQSFLSKPFLFLIAWQGVMLAAFILAAYYWAVQTYGEGAHARTIALLVLIAGQIGHLFNCRSRTRSTFSNFFGNPFVFGAVAIVIAAQIMAIYFPPLARILDTTQPNKIDFLVIAVSMILPVVIVEITKAFAKWRSKK